MSDLEYVETKELIRELSKRYPTLIFVGSSAIGGDGPGHAFLIKGNPVSIYGLASVVKDQMRMRANDYLELEHKDEDDE